MHERTFIASVPAEMITLMPDVLIIGIAFQFASESIVTSSVGDDINVFKIAQMYWSISSPSVNAVLLMAEAQTEKRMICWD